MQMNPENSIIVAEFSENRPAGSEGEINFFKLVRFQTIMIF